MAMEGRYFVVKRKKFAVEKDTGHFGEEDEEEKFDVKRYKTFCFGRHPLIHWIKSSGSDLEMEREGDTWGWRESGSVEAHNIIDWKTVPIECENYVGNYVLGDQYRADSKFVNREGYFYAKTVNVAGDGKDIWVFDIDETTLSNLPYYAKHGFGVNPYNDTLFNEWVDLGAAPALPETQKFYNKLLNLGIKIVFLTGRPLKQRDITAKNLKKVGYHTWEKLILKNTTLYHGKTAVSYKSSERKKLEEAGYRIIGNIGDQWSDILGTNTGSRTFKLPDPLYYIA